MKLVTISGLDGSGKSTQIKLLENYLASQGKKFFYFHAIKFGIANKIKNVIKNKCIIILRPWNYDTFEKNERSVIKANKFQIWMRKIFLLLDLWRFKNLIAKLEKEGYDYLISDRYFYDSVVNVEYLENVSVLESPERDSNIPSVPESSVRDSGDETKSGIATSPVAPRNDIIRPAVAVYLQTSPEIIMQRERIPDQGIEYLQKKKEIYDKYAKIWNLKIINVNRTMEEVFEEIKKEISNSPNF